MADEPIVEPAPEPAAPAPSGPTPVAGAPPAAKIVLTGQRTERELTLETELESEKSSHAKTAKEKKEREIKIAELEDELHRVRHPARPQPAEKKTALEEFFDA